MMVATMIIAGRCAECNDDGEYDDDDNEGGDDHNGHGRNSALTTETS